MKNPQKITRVKLKLTESCDFNFIGLVSSEPDYKLSLTLNKKFRIALKNIAPINISDGNLNELTFSRFSDANSSHNPSFTLISNRSGKQFFLKNLKNIDYILKIQDSDNEDIVNKITTKLREIETITAVFSIDINSIQDKYLHYLT
jgi:hypothetical protein